MLFGTIPRGEAGDRERVHDAITEMLDEFGRHRTLVELGLHYPAGTGGSRLTEAQQQVGASDSGPQSARYYRFQRPTAVIDSETEATILQRLKHELSGRSLFCNLDRTRFASAFDRILIIEQGRVVDQGGFAELQKPGSALAPLMAAE